MASIGISIEPNPKKNEENETDEVEAGPRAPDQPCARTRSFHSRPLSAATTPRSRPSSPANAFGSSSAYYPPWNSFPYWVVERLGLLSESSKQRKRRAGKAWYRKRARGVAVGLLACFLVLNWWMLSRIQDSNRGFRHGFLRANSSTVSIREELIKLEKVKRPQKTIYAKLLAKAAHALAEGQNKPEPRELWVEPYLLASTWRPCADQLNWEPSGGDNGYIMVSANGGINQQRVAVCNAVAVTRLLNATLVVPKFLYSSVWRDPSDIYQEEHFINYLKPDIRIVKELPQELQSLDLEAIGSVVTDAEIMKEAKPSFYVKHILPILHRNRVVHFVGFGNRLSSDPIPFQLQRLRCRCNFHALKFVPKLQEAGALLLKRMRQNGRNTGPLDHYLVGPFSETKIKGGNGHSTKGSRFLALHLRFEIDMVAHSLCEFGGGEKERRELESYRETHFPALTQLKKTTKLQSPATRRAEGLCPLMPEETVLMLAALGFKRKTPVFLAGAHIYGGKSRMAALTSLYPNLVTKESLLSSSEIQPFMNFSSQLAALDFIVCTAADSFAMTDSGSQLSSLVSGYRVYYGGGKMPTIRPNKRRLADIFLKNDTIEWKFFEGRVRKSVRQTKRVRARPVGRSVYRYPRCKECMCSTEEE